MDDEWARPMKKWKGRWRREAIDILFPADPRRPEKNHYLALQTGEILEQRGWIVGMTTLKQQPRSIVWDRMIVADVTLITSHRESGPLVGVNPFFAEHPSFRPMSVMLHVIFQTDWFLTIRHLKRWLMLVKLHSKLIGLRHHHSASSFSAKRVAQQWSSLLQGLEEEE